MRLVGSCAGRANGSTPGDQITGCTVDQATGAARCYARLHAAFWESPALSAPADAPESLSWVVEPTEPRWSELVSPFMQQHADGAFLEQDLPPLPPADGAGGAAVAAAAAAPRRLEVPPGTKEMLRKIAMHWDWLNAEMASSPRTLTHWCDKQRFYLVLLCCAVCATFVVFARACLRGDDRIKKTPLAVSVLSHRDSRTDNLFFDQVRKQGFGPLLI